MSDAQSMPSAVQVLRERVAQLESVYTSASSLKMEAESKLRDAKEEVEKLQSELSREQGRREDAERKLAEAKMDAAKWLGKYEAVREFSADRLDVILNGVAEKI